MTRFAAAGLIAFACASVGEVPLDTAFILSYGESVTVGTTGLSMTFAEVEDSRCPRNVVCVWQGEVEVRLVVSAGGRSEEVAVKAPGTASALGYGIELREVTPYPEDPPPPKKSYKATLVVTRFTGSSDGKSGR